MGLKPHEFLELKGELITMAAEVREPAIQAQRARAGAHLVGGRIAEMTGEMAARATNLANQAANDVEAIANRCGYMAAECDQWRSRWRRYEREKDDWERDCQWEDDQAAIEGRSPIYPARPSRPDNPPAWVSLDP